MLIYNPLVCDPRLSNPSDAFDAVRPPRLILADDDREMRTMLAQSLRRDGYHVVEAVDGNELEALIHSSFRATPRGEPIDLILRTAILNTVPPTWSV